MLVDGSGQVSRLTEVLIDGENVNALSDYPDQRRPEAPPRDELV